MLDKKQDMQMMDIQEVINMKKKKKHNTYYNFLLSLVAAKL